MEYPWYAAWDLGFHCIAMAMVDPVFAKHQLILIMREWYMKPDGQIPAYEWNFGDVNPPVHAWSSLQVYHIEKGKRERVILLFKTCVSKTHYQFHLVDQQERPERE